MDNIWHCPGCNKIIVKTEIPYLGKGSLKCAECNDIFTFDEIIEKNKNNIIKGANKYLKELK